MAEVNGTTGGFVISAYDSFIALFPPSTHSAVEVLIYGIGILIVSLFIWKFYKSISKEDIISLNLRQYNTSEHPVLKKLLAISLYFAEYILIIPFIILLWFIALSVIVLLIASSERAIIHTLILTAGLIIAIRVFAYFNQKLSEELAKLMPFVMLSAFIMNPLSDIGGTFARTSGIPALISDAFSFIIIIGAVEIVLRIFYEIYDFYSSEVDEDLDITNIKEIRAVQRKSD